MLNKSHSLSRYKANSSKNKKKMFDAFWPWKLGSLSLAIDTRYKFSSITFTCFTSFSQLQFDLIGCMILMKEYVSLTAGAMKMGKRHFYSDNSNHC